MANKQTLPNTQRFQESYIQTKGAPLIPTMDFKSPMRGVAGVLEQAADFGNTYTKLRYEGYEAQGTKLMADMAHAMEDAKDPCELEDIRKQYESQLNTIGGDDIFGKSYRKSRYFTNFKNKWDINAEKVYLNKMHDFELIQAEDTGNQIASTISQLNDPASVESGIAAYEASLAGIQHMDAQTKYKLMTNFYKNTVSQIYNSDPNKAVAWLDYAGDKYDGYGVDANEIRTKADNYNKAKQKEYEAEIARAEKQKTQEDKVNGLALAQAVATGKMSESEANLVASDMSPIAWNEFRKASPKKSSSSKTETDYKTVHDVFLSESDDKIGDWNDFKLNHPELTPTQITRGDNLAKIFETKDTTSKNPITVTDEIKVGQVQSGELIMSDKDIKDNSHGNATLAKEFRTARASYNKSLADKLKKETEEQEKAQKEEQAKEEKRANKEAKDKSNIALAEINYADDKNVADVFKQNIKDLTPEDLKIASLRVKNARDRLAERAEKAEGEEKKSLEKNLKELETAGRNARFNMMYDALSNDPNAFTDEQINKANIEQSQKEKLKKAKESSEKNQIANQKNFLSEKRREMRANISSKWEKGVIITNIDDVLENYPYKDNEDREEVYDWIIKNNKAVADSNWADVKNQFFTFCQQNRLVSDEEIKGFVNKIDSKGTGKNYQEMFEGLSEIRNKIESSMSSEIKEALNKFDVVWGDSLFGEATQVEKMQKMAAKDFYANLLMNQKNLDDIQKVSTNEYIWGLVSNYKPKPEDILSSMEEKNTLVTSLDNKEKELFDYDKKTKKLVAKPNIEYTDTVQLRQLLNTAVNKKLLSKEEYEKMSRPYSEVTAYAIQKLEKKPDTVLGAIYNYLKSRLGEYYNPATMTNNLDEAVSLLYNMNINPNGSINRNFGDIILRTPESVYDTNRLGVLAVGTALGLNMEKNKVDARAENGQVIKLGD